MMNLLISKVEDSRPSVLNVIQRYQNSLVYNVPQNVRLPVHAFSEFGCLWTVDSAN